MLNQTIESMRNSIENTDCRSETVTIPMETAKKALDILCNYKLCLERRIRDCQDEIERAKFEILQNEKITIPVFQK